MDFQVRISHPALIDFEDILEYSWANFPANAEHFGNAILNHVDLLKTFPYIGGRAPRRAATYPYSNPDLLPRPGRLQCGRDSALLARLTQRPCHLNSDTTLSYGEYVPSTQGINFAPIVQRAESRARFHARLHSQEDSVEILRREWFCIAKSNLVVMIYLSV